MTTRMGYAELFAAVAQRYAGTFQISVGTWRFLRTGREPDLRTTWEIAFYIDETRGTDAPVRIVKGASPDEALAAFEAGLSALPAPVTDATAVGELVGTAEVQS